MKRKILFIMIFMFLSANLFAQSVGQVIKGKAPNGSFIPVTVDADGKMNVSGVVSGGGGSSTVTLPVASATQNATQALPIALGASDQSVIQRLFTALVMGDGVNGNNMLPMANYTWNGTAWDRMIFKGSQASPTYVIATGTNPGTLASPSYTNLSNSSALQYGLVVNTQYSVATNSFLSLANAAAGVIPPYTIVITNTGNGKLLRSMGTVGFTATSSAAFIAPGDYASYYCATSTINYNFIATDSVGAANVEVHK